MAFREIEHVHSSHADGMVCIGNGVGVAGRWLRLFLGIQTVLFFVLNPIIVNPIPSAEILGYAQTLLTWFALIVVIYLAVFRMLGDFLFARLNPWAGTTIFLGIPTLLGLLQVLPQEWSMAWGFYVGSSLILTFFLRYGGCEVVALPTILFGKRYTMYCPFNAFDVMERAVTPDAYAPWRQIMTIISLGIVTIIGGSFMLFTAYRIFGWAGLVVPLQPEWAWPLVIPLADMVWRTVEALRDGDGWLDPRVRKFGLGAFLLVIGILSFPLDYINRRDAWRVMMAAGAVYVVVQILRRLAVRKDPAASEITGAE